MELADSGALKALALYRACGFESHPGHSFQPFVLDGRSERALTPNAECVKKPARLDRYSGTFRRRRWAWDAHQDGGNAGVLGGRHEARHANGKRDWTGGCCG